MESVTRHNNATATLPTHWDESCEVLVVGSGFAGLAAAIEANKAGSSVIVIEKMRGYGGNSTICDGGIAAPDTPMRRKFSLTSSKVTSARITNIRRR